MILLHRKHSNACCCNKSGLKSNIDFVEYEKALFKLLIVGFSDSLSSAWAAFTGLYTGFSLALNVKNILLGGGQFGSLKQSGPSLYDFELDISTKLFGGCNFEAASGAVNNFPGRCVNAIWIFTKLSTNA